MNESPEDDGWDEDLNAGLNKRKGIGTMGRAWVGRTFITHNLNPTRLLWGFEETQWAQAKGQCWAKHINNTQVNKTIVRKQPFIKWRIRSKRENNSIFGFGNNKQQTTRLWGNTLKANKTKHKTMWDQKEGAILLKQINQTSKTLKKHITRSHIRRIWASKQYKFDR